MATVHAATGITFHPLATARPKAIIGVKSQLNAFSKLHKMPHAAKGARPILIKIATGEIIYPPALLETALNTLASLKGHDQVDKEATLAFSTVAVELLVQAKDFKDLGNTSKFLLVEVAKGNITFIPERTSEAIEAITNLTAVPDLKESAEKALLKLQPTPAAPVIAPPVQALTPAPAPTAAPDIKTMKPEDMPNRILLAAMGANVPGARDEAIKRLNITKTITWDFIFDVLKQSHDHQEIDGAVQLIAVTSKDPLINLVKSYWNTGFSQFVRAVILAVIIRDLRPAKEIVDIIQNTGMVLDSLTLAMDKVKTIDTDPNKTVYRQLLRSYHLTQANGMVLLKSLIKIAALQEKQVQALVNPAPVPENVLDLNLPADDIDKEAANFEKEITVIEKKKADAEKELAWVNQSIDKAKERLVLYISQRLPHAEQTKNTNYQDFLKVLHSTISNAVSKMREAVPSAELVYESPHDENGHDILWKQNLDIDQHVQAAFFAFEQKLKQTEQELDSFISSLDLGSPLNKTQIETLVKLLQKLSVHPDNIEHIVNLISAVNGKALWIEQKAKPHIATVQGLIELLNEKKQDIEQSLLDLEQDKVALAAKIGDSMQRRQQKAFEMLSAWQDKLNQRAEEAINAHHRAVGRLSSLVEKLGVPAALVDTRVTPAKTIDLKALEIKSPN